MTRVVVRPQVNKVRILGCFDPNYGSFEFRGADQTWTETSPMPLNHTNFAKHIEIGEGGAISFREKGKYDIQFSAQLIKLTGGTHSAEIWLQQNGEAIPHSNTAVTIGGGQNTALAVAWNWFVDVEANDYVQLYWWVDATNTIKIDSRAATGGRPEIPGLIVTVNQVG